MKRRKVYHNITSYVIGAIGWKKGRTSDISKLDDVVWHIIKMNVLTDIRLGRMTEC